MEADAAAQEEALPSRPGQVGPHRKSVFVAASGDLELVAREPDVQAVEVLPDLLADERVRVVTRDVLLVRLPGLRVGDDRFELRHGIPSERDASMRGFHIRLPPGDSRGGGIGVDAAFNATSGRAQGSGRIPDTPRRLPGPRPRTCPAPRRPPR